MTTWDVRARVLSVVAVVLVATAPASSAADPLEVTLQLEGSSVVSPQSTVRVRLHVDGGDATAAGLQVRFVRQGPGERSDDTCPDPTAGDCAITDADGRATYTFVPGRQGSIAVGAAVYSGSGELLGSAGPVRVDAVVACGGPVVARCSPPATLYLRGKDEGRTDRLRVGSVGFDRPPVVQLLRKAGGTRKRVASQRTGRAGGAVFRVRDTNGAKPTAYRVRSAGVGGGPIRSKVLRLR